MAIRFPAFALVALGLAGCLTGCARGIAGTPVPGAPGVAAPMSASKELGDFSTIDPCRMIDVQGLPANLRAEPEPAESLDYCALHVNSGGTNIQLDVGALIYDKDDSDEIGPQSLPSGLALYTGKLQDTSCTAYLKFSEAIEMTSVAYANDGDGTSDLCTTAATVARNVSGVLAKGPVRHRGFPANSFAKIDPCTLVDSATLTPLGLNSAGKKAYPARHECDWESGGGNDLSIYLTFIVGPPPVAQANVSTEEQISGRSSVEFSTTDDSAAECWINTGGAAFGAQQNLVEIAEVYVNETNVSADTACQLGTTLATAVWPKIPTTS